jgi:F1F0 ATPase subunit 2
MSDILLLSFSFVAGVLLGLFLFGGLYLTVRDLPATERPLHRLILSFLARMIITLAGMAGVLWIAESRWEALALCLIGLLTARTVLVRRLTPRPSA